MSKNPLAFILRNAHVRHRSRSLFRRSKEHHILNDISLDIRRGEILGVVGLNGAGKSTLLRLIAGILEPDGGIVTRHAATIALLAFSGGLFPDCSARANTVMLLMLQQHIGITEAENMVDCIAEYAELKNYIDMPLRTFSTGMLARLKFAIATQSNADALLIDELLAVGDTAFAMKSFATMQKKLSSGTTSILVTHSRELIVSFCTRVIWLEKGKLIAEGLPTQIMNEYQKFISERMDKNGEHA